MLLEILMLGILFSIIGVIVMLFLELINNHNRHINLNNSNLADLTANEKYLQRIIKEQAQMRKDKEANIKNTIDDKVKRDNDLNCILNKHKKIQQGK